MGKKRNFKTWLVISVVLLTLWPAVAGGEIIYVRASASASGNGQTWGTAYKYLQDALYKPPTGGDEIWVAAGTYKPDADEGGNVTPDSRYETFQLINGVAIYGGFPSGGSTWEQRDPNVYETILSGDINTPGDINDNSYHVVTGSGTDATAVMDGFTITGGNANGSNPYDRGGGMYNDSGSPTVTSCTFSGNSAGSVGGGMCNRNGSDPTLTNCTFTGNGTSGAGGGMYNDSSSPTLTNCIFTGNSADFSGGGMQNWDSSSPTVTNCTFSGNSADNGGGMRNVNSSPMVTNCILWANTAGNGNEIYNNSSTPLISYCDIADCLPGGSWDSALGTDGGGNIDADPCFVDANGPDDILGTEDDNLRLLEGSPCIDAGDNTAVPGGVTTDLDGNPRFVDDPYTADTGNGTPPIVDMGAYEYLVCELTVSSTSGGIVSQPGQGVFEYTYGTVVPIVAEADPCYVFVEWTGTAVDAGKVADPYAATTTVTVDADYTLVANFDTHMLTVSSTSGGNVTSPGEGVFLHPSDTVVAIVAEADPCYVFVEWTGTAVDAGKVADPYAATTTVTVDADYTLMANFRESDYDPDQAWNPSPFDTEVFVYPDVTLSWMPGDGIGSRSRHLVYFGTDYTAVENSPMLTEPGFPGPEYQGMSSRWFDLDWVIGDVEGGKTYYWRIDEFNEDSSITKGDVWRFTTGAHIYVDESAMGGNDGTSWTDAYNYLQDALADPCLESGYEIWVAEGTYKPDESTAVPGGTGLRTDTFELINGVAIYGGFPSGGTWEERNPQTYETILSGDIGTPGDSSDNSYHVVTGSGTNATAVLDGFTITAGNANGGGTDNYGAGMYNDNGSPQVTNCAFSGNSAWDGGGIYNNSSSPTVTGCTLIDNWANIGGGMSNRTASNPMLVNCTFYDNWASDGGGMYNGESSSPTLTDCTFSGNWAGGDGGGMNNNQSGPNVINCTFSQNSASGFGGGMHNYDSSPIVANCILWGNSAPSGAQIYDDGTSSPTVTYCDVEGGYPGTGNIGDDPNDDPLFRDADGEDDIVGTEDDDLRLWAYSPCIDAGDNDAVPGGVTTDLDGKPRFFDDPVTDDTGSGTPPIVDMGAYEFQDVCGDAEHPYPAGDLNHDCYVDFYDFAIFCLSWLECTAPECD